MGDANDNITLFQPLLNILNHECSWHPDSQYSGQKFSPLEFVLMAKADLATVQQVYEMQPQALTAKTLENICRTGFSPGVLGFLAGKIPHALSQSFEGRQHNDTIQLGDTLLIHKAIDDAEDDHLIQSENDIMKLIEINPQSITAPNNCGWLTWELALGRKFSRAFYNFIFQQLFLVQETELSIKQDVFANTDDRRGFDIDCVLGMAPVLSRIKTLDITDHSWKIEALVEFIKLILQNHNLVDLTLETRFLTTDDHEYQHSKKYDEITILDDNNFLVDGDLPPATYQYFTELMPRSGIQSLTLVFNNEHALQGLASFIWDVVLHLPRLKEFGLSFERQPPTIEPLKQLLGSSRTLESLEVSFSFTSDDICDPVLEGLAKNSLLKRLFISIDLRESILSKLQERLLDILQDNTMLEVVKHRKGRSHANSGWKKIDYYTLLNRCGRAVARNPNTTLNGFVRLLHQEPLLQESTLEQSNILFGLLRESPGLWSCHGSGDDSWPSRKRKRQLVKKSRVELKRDRHRRVTRVQWLHNLYL